MAFSDKKTRRRLLRSMDLLKVALVVITLSGVYLFMMVHDIEKTYIKADVSLPRNVGAELQWNDSYVQGMGKTQETSDHLENDDTFQDLFNFDSDYAEEIKPTSKPIFQRKSNFRKRRSVFKSVRRRENSDFQNGSVSQLDSQRQSSPIDSRRSSSNLRKPSDYQRQAESIKSANDHRPTSFRKELEHSEQHAPHLQMEPKDKELQQSKTAHLSNDEITQSREPSHLPQDEETPKKGQIREPFLPESQTNFHQQKIEEIPSLSQTKNSPTDKDITIDDIDLDKSRENLNDRSLAESQASDLKEKSGRKSTYDGNSKGSMSEPESFDIHPNDITLIRSQKERPNSNKVALNHQGAITDNKQRSDPLLKTSSEKARSDSEQDPSKVASNHQRKPPPKITDNKQHSEPLPKTSSKKARFESEQDSSKVASNHQRKPPPKIADNKQYSDLLPGTSSEKSRSHSEEVSRKVASNHQGKQPPEITDNEQYSDPLPGTSSEKSRSHSEEVSRKVASNHQGKQPPEITDNEQYSDLLPGTSSEKSRSHSEQVSRKVDSNHQGKQPPEITDNEQYSDPHPKTNSEKRKSLLIFGDDRSGTTFVTKMFAADPQMFTVYEPLWVTKKWFSQLQIREQKKIQFTRDVVNALLSCQFTRSKAGKQFLSHTSSSWVGNGVFEKNVFRSSPFAKKTTSGRNTWPNLYQNPEFAEEVCLNKFNHSVIKVGQVRVPTESISVFIPNVFLANPDTDIRIIQIVRDPRGSINSRIRAGWISDFTFTGFPTVVDRLCSKIRANIQFARKLDSAFIKERYMEINYHEITSMPVTTAKKIYKFAGFEMPDSLIDWIVQSTNPDERQLRQALNNPFSHVRDARKNYLKWRSESPIKRVRIIEQQCKDLLDLLGLDAVADEMETLCS